MQGPTENRQGEWAPWLNIIIIIIIIIWSVIFRTVYFLVDFCADIQTGCTNFLFQSGLIHSKAMPQLVLSRSECAVTVDYADTSVEGYPVVIAKRY